MASKTRLTVLKRRSDFLFILKNGRRIHASSWLVLNFTANAEGSMRCGWTLPRQVGSAVIRNRLKRWARVFFREKLGSGDTAPVDINLVFRRAEKDFYKKLDYETFARVLDRGWKQVQKGPQRRSSNASSPSRSDI